MREGDVASPAKSSRPAPWLPVNGIVSAFIITVNLEKCIFRSLGATPIPGKALSEGKRPVLQCCTSTEYLVIQKWLLGMRKPIPGMVSHDLS